MKKKRNYKRKDIQKKITDIDIDIEIDNNDENIETVNDDIELDDLDEDMAERLSYYENVETEEEEEIKEFLNRDYDVVAESRRRVNQPGKRKFSDKSSDEVKLSKPKREKKKKTEKQENKKEKDAINVWEKWLNIYHNNTFKILYGTLASLAVVLVIVIIISLVSEGDASKTGDNGKTTQSTEKGTETQTQTEAPTEQTTTLEDTIKPESAESDIHKLITSYIDAAYLKADIELVKNYVDDVTNINVEEYKSRQKYIEAYENIKCYKFDYSQSNTYIVAVTYDEKIYNIKTAAPSGTVFVVKYNGVDKKYYIHNITESEQLDVYIASRAQEINIIGTKVKERLEEAKNADAELKAVLDIMENIANKQEETSTVEETTSVE